MLETINLHKTMMEEEYKPEIRVLKEKLKVLQQKVKEAELPVIILVEGWSASGKGKAIARLIEELDPRNFKVHSTLESTKEEKRKPFLWRHWSKIPVRGQLAIFDRSWYQDIVVALKDDLKVDEILYRADGINTFERQLTDDGYLIIKFFLHIGQKEQGKRLKKLASDKNTAWRVTNADWKQNENYDVYYSAFDGMLQYTSTEYAPWHVLSSHDKRYKTIEMYKIVIDEIEQALAARQNPKETELKEVEEVAATTDTMVAQPISVQNAFSLVKVQKLQEINLAKTIDPEKYKRILKEKQKELSELHNRLYRDKIPVVIIYEGWDAA